jgi:probable phosphoglycerate mutase
VAGYGAVVRDGVTGEVLVELAEPIGVATNNVAEYSGLVAGLRTAAAVDPGAHVHVRMDSQLVVEQMAGRWRIRHDDMRRLASQAREVCDAIVAAGGSVEFEWVPRDRNTAADALSNEAMDGASVHRVPAGESALQPGASPATDQRAPGAELRSGVVRPLRLLLVQPPDDAALVSRVVEATMEHAGNAPALHSSPHAAAERLVAALAERLATEPHTASEWGDDGPGPVVAAYESLRQGGGTAVVVTGPRVVGALLAAALGVPDDRAPRVVTEPGSLTLLEVGGDGTVTLAFTNRTTHLA